MMMMMMMMMMIDDDDGSPRYFTIIHNSALFLEKIIEKTHTHKVCSETSQNFPITSLRDSWLSYIYPPQSNFLEQ
jgi:hypothetical protein